MTLITTWFINLILLPGKMLHTVITKNLTYRYDLKIHSLNYLEIASDRSQIVYDSPMSLKEKYVLGLGPCMLLNSFAIMMYYFALTADHNALFLLFAYLGLATSYASFPATDISYELWKATIHNIKKGEILAIIFFFPVAIINLMKILSIFSMEFLFAIGLFLLVSIAINTNFFEAY
ncbi:hypothetical protein [uncultured Dokdonia sp.]|uniref:hypothetical protein n=1 Tax=uncultured Dokdonia sp. TaxID=575653 RepID=UPI002635142E|nr:hypothetical protein [uncultured Dokdonia sp.]